MGLSGLAVIAAAVVFTPWSQVLPELLLWPTLFLVVAAVAGEVKPLLIGSRAQERTLSTSAPFVLALIAVGGLGIAVVVQAVASVVDDLHQRRAWTKSLFNTAQYALSVVAGRAIYSWLAGVPIFGGPSTVSPGQIVPLVIAGACMFLVNWILVAGVISLSTGQSLQLVLRDDLRDLLVSNVVLLCVGGIAAIVADDGVGALALLGAPVIAAHLFVSASARHAYDATHDSLTGLGNRGQLHRELERGFEAADDTDTAGPSLVLFDLDHFKDINDTLGHPVGDQILRHVAGQLVAAAPDNASVHRLGGDEFAVVVRGGLLEARQMARELLASFDNAVPVGELELLVRASVGVAVAPEHGEDGETLMKNADIALYHAKLERDRISTYSPDLDVNTVERLQLLADLRTAIDKRELHVAYQPQVDLMDHRTVGVEVLVRWYHPRRGLVAPDEFVPLAENSGLIFPLTAFVLDTALGQLASWRALGYKLRLAVNLSARHLSDLGLPDQVAQAAKLHGVPLNSLVLEVTETGILSDPARADVVIRALRAMGVEISIDDYGTGNASLSYLKRLEIDELKIDRSFVCDIRSDDHDLIIVRSTIELALALGLRVVAEGIEDEPTATTLRAMGRVIGQGYHLGEPNSAEQMEARLRGEAQTAAAARQAAR
ncbi:EAL domain-containing protein [Demequina sp. TMPB413]|uniref:putative bifunctional diguanylate cyclase/phosphodiesterase n=1 Tax=Demequina sp. TMPB413 TaxID=2881056 RepID=UPI001CF556CA|nr:EAL domain-containing protein [Demequina sp. TMPB413]UPU89497.1 EAL domain-containing protein [Demequina sp. TMPB413]